jgi:hypothetical protein
MKKNLLFLILIGFCLNSGAQIQFQRTYTNVGNLGLAITNVGTVGRPNVRTSPKLGASMRYPLSSGVEHLFEGGLWIGAQKDGQIVVSSGAVDASNGYQTGAAGFEFTQLSGFKQSSKLTTSPFYSSSAISHQDYNVSFTDSNIIIPGTTQLISGHKNPLKAVVNLSTYAWNYSYADYYVILDYKIKNYSNTKWDSVYLGTWTDLVVRNVNVTIESGTAFFNKGNNGYIDSLKAIYSSEVSGDDIAYTKSYGSVQILGVIYKDNYFYPNNDSALNAKGYKAPTVFPNFWDFTGVIEPFNKPNSDLERYSKMRGTKIDFNNPNQARNLASASNKTQMISIGPLPSIAPGEEIEYVMAFVCAPQLSDRTDTLDTKNARATLASNLLSAKRTFLGEDVNGNGILDKGEDVNGNNKLDRYILPEPPATPKIKVITTNNQVDIYWDKRSVESIDPITKQKDFEGYKVYKSNLGDDLDQSLSNDLKLIASFDSTGNKYGYNNGFKEIELPSPVMFEGDTNKYYFKYTINNIPNGWQFQYAVTAFDKGNEKLKIGSLQSSITAGSYRAFAGTTPVEIKDGSPEIGIYPNPYSTTAAWDGSSSKTKKIYFYNLPNSCTINIFTAGGEQVAQLDHLGTDYNGQDIQWFINFANDKNLVTSGGEHAWDLLSTNNQLVSQGLYIFSVTDKKTGNIKTGKFTVLK